MVKILKSKINHRNHNKRTTKGLKLISDRSQFNYPDDIIGDLTTGKISHLHKFAERCGRTKSSIPKTTYKEILKSKDSDGVSLDAHSWCEDSDGNILYDPDYDAEFRFTKVLFNLTDKKVYKKFDPILQKICFKATKKQVDDLWDLLKRLGDCSDKDTAKTILKLAENGKLFGDCFIVAKAYQTLNPDAKIVCGSFGWIGYDGCPHYEYG